MAAAVATIERRAMGHHHARDGYETVRVPEKYRPLLRRLQAEHWDRENLAWIVRQHRDLPPIIAGLIREKLAALQNGS
jgi:hypothetical protein